jgi:hypothetical protein
MVFAPVMGYASFSIRSSILTIIQVIPPKINCHISRGGDSLPPSKGAVGAFPKKHCIATKKTKWIEKY